MSDRILFLRAAGGVSSIDQALYELVRMGLNGAGKLSPRQS